jgi:hypothetical protein
VAIETLTILKRKLHDRSQLLKGFRVLLSN